jgi:tetratricopeptide (TPR) repeat protein
MKAFLAAVVALALAGCRDRPAAEFRSDDADSPQAHASWWVATYGRLPPDHPLQVRAERVFARIESASERRTNRPQHLEVIAADRGPWAIALPSGAVILTRGGLELCYHEVPVEQGDARLAFVLGHELAHLANDDFWHLPAFAQRLDQSSLVPRWLARLLRPFPEGAPGRELRADEAGIVAMTMAGYDPRPLVEEDRSFVEEWVEEVTGDVRSADATHPEPEARTDYVRHRLTDLADQLLVFHFGVRLLELGRYRDAISLLELFRQRFPSREVLNNLGVAYYQLALRTLNGCDSSLVLRFMLPAVVDSDTLARRVRWRGPGEESRCYDDEEFRGDLQEATRHFLDAKRRDPTYSPALLNLVSLYIVSGQPANALATAEDARAVMPDDPRLESAAAVALDRYGLRRGFETADQALQRLEELARRSPDRPELLYNYAAILAERGRTAAARDVWKKFLELVDSGPYAAVARDWIDAGSPKPQGGQAQSRTEAPTSPLPLGMIDALVKDRLQPMVSRPFVSGEFRGVIHEQGGQRALQIGRALEIVDVDVSPPGDPANLERYGPPLKEITTARGRVVLYSGFGFEIEDGRTTRQIFFVPSPPAADD